MSDSLPRLIVLAIGGSIAPPLLLLRWRREHRVSTVGRIISATFALCFVLGWFFFLRDFLGA
jgi:hypothetical protein